MEAAEQLMRSSPVDEVTIAGITQAADVGHGTFYLHFKSKYEVMVPIVQSLAADWDTQLQAETASMDDPAEVIAYSARQMGRRIVGDPLWCWLLQHSGVPVDEIRQAVGSFSSRDFGRGLMTGRFQVPTLQVGSVFMLGGYVNGLMAAIPSDDAGEIIDQVVEMMLRVMGVPPEEAADIAHRPLIDSET